MSTRVVFGWTRRLGGMFVVGVVAGLTTVAVWPAPFSQASSPAPTTTGQTLHTQPRTVSGRNSVRPSRPTRQAARPVTLAFAGDVMFEGSIEPLLDDDPRQVLAGVRPVLAHADVTMVNLETAITARGVAAPKEFTFRAPPSALDALTAGGVDVVSLANNHGMDYGPDGFADTLRAARDAGLPMIGAGRSEAAAYAPFITRVGGRRIAVVAATQVMDAAFLDTWPAVGDRPGLASAKAEHEQRLVRAVRKARTRTDTVVVYLHWGVELHTCPTSTQQLLARRLVTAGADVIVGTHAHRLQGAGMLDGALVAYGLGNFVFAAPSPSGTESGVLLVTISPRGDVAYEWKPARIANGVPQLLTGEAATAAVAAWTQLRACTGLTVGSARTSPPP